MSCAVQRDRRRRADVGLRRHRRQVGRHRDHGASGVCARAGRRDVDDHRHRRGEEALHDPSHRGSQTAGRVQDEHHRCVVAILGAIDLVLDVLLRDRVDVVVEMNGENARCVALCENARRGSKRPESERESTKSPQIAAWHRCKDSISGGSKLLPPKDRRATLESPCAASAFSPSPSSSRSPSHRPPSARALRTWRRSSSARRVRTRSERPRRSRASRWRASPGADPGRCCSALAQPAVAGAPGGRELPRTRTAPTSARRSDGSPLGGRAIRGG